MTVHVHDDNSLSLSLSLSFYTYTHTHTHYTGYFACPPGYAEGADVSPPPDIKGACANMSEAAQGLGFRV